MFNRVMIDAGCISMKHRYIALLIALLVLSFVFEASATAHSENNNQNELNRALLRAISLGRMNNVDALLKQGASANASAQDHNKRSALIVAAAMGHIDLARLLLVRGAKIDYQDSAGLTALNWSVMRQRSGVALMLIEQNANIHIGDNRGITPLMFAVATKNTNLIKKLVEHGSNLNVQSRSSKMIPLLVAIENADLQTLNLLLSLGADINGSNHEGYTPLMAASESGQLEIVKVLLAQGAKVDMQTNDKRSALSLAKQNGHILVQYQLREHRQK